MSAANVVFRANSWHPSNTFKHNVYPTNIVTLTRHMIFLDALLQWWILGVENNLSKTGLNVNLWTKPISIQSKLMGYVMNPIHNYFILSRPEFNIYIYTLSMLVGQKKWPIAFEFYNGTQSLPFTRANLLFRLRRSFSGTIPKGPGRIDIYSIPPWQTSRPSDFQGIQSSHISEECGQYIWNGLCIGSDGLRSVFPKRINFGFNVANPRINLPFGDGL